MLYKQQHQESVFNDKSNIDLDQYIWRRIVVDELPELFFYPLQNHTHHIMGQQQHTAVQKNYQKVSAVVTNYILNLRKRHGWAVTATPLPDAGESARGLFQFLGFEVDGDDVGLHEYSAALKKRVDAYINVVA